jgi:hypothetical protein
MKRQVTLLVKLRNSVKGKISAPSADIIPRWEYIRTQGADITKLGDITMNKEKI